MNTRRMLAGLATLAAVAGLEGMEPGLAGARSGEGAAARSGVSEASSPAPSGARNLMWCLRGVQLYAAGAAGSDLLEVSGAVLMYFNCR